MEKKVVAASQPIPQCGPAPALADALVRTLTPARVDVLNRLAAGGAGRTVADLATEAGQHENTVREHLEALVRAGLVERNRAEASGRGRPAWVYSALPGMAMGDRAREYAGLAAALAGQIARTSPDPRADALTAGEAWGADLVRTQPGSTPGDPGQTPPNPGTSLREARTQVVELLERLGFAPRPDKSARTVRLTRCPLLEVARRYPDVVCWVHLGVTRGALRAFDCDPEGAAVHPFAEPGACLLDLPTRV